MNVLITTDAFPPRSGGSGRSTATLAGALLRRGHRVRVVVSRSRPLDQREWQGIPVSEVAIPRARMGSRERERAFASGLQEALGEEAWDVVHAQHWLSARATADACPRLPRVVTVRDYWADCIWSTRLSGASVCPGCSYTRRVVCAGRRRPWLWPLAPAVPPFIGAELARRERVLRESSGIVAVSRYVADTLPVAGACVLPNFLERDRPARERPADAPARYVLFLGKLEPNKAPDRLIPSLEASGCDVPLLIAGTGSLEATVRRQAEASSLDVRMLGWVDEERSLALMRHASALVFPSRWQEPLSRVLVDGLGEGAVMVVEPTGGSADAVVDGESGLLAAGAEALGDALRRVLTDDALAERLRAGARARAESTFSEDVVAPKFEALYERVSVSST